jgi:hypothetical protein
MICCPLKEDEVALGETVYLEIESSTNELSLEQIDVYVVDSTQLRIRDPIPDDWQFSAGKVTDFADDVNTEGIVCSTEIGYICTCLSAADFEVCEDLEVAKEILKLMYRNSEMSLICRRIVVKGFGSNDCLEQVWGEAIKEVCEDGSVCKEIVPLLWRDFLLLGDVGKKTVGQSVWRAMDIGGGIHAISAAMMA